MSTKHTPGPWTIDSQVDERGDGHVSIRGKPDSHPTIGKQICTINPYLDTRLNGANARLIAAAPELLEALRDIAKKLNDHNETENQRLAYIRRRLSYPIAKATGGAK